MLIRASPVFAKNVTMAPRSFATLRKLPCDVFLGAHGPFYDLEQKYAKLQSGSPNPFIDHAGYMAYIDLKEKQFNEELARQKKGGKT